MKKLLVLILFLVDFPAGNSSNIQTVVLQIIPRPLMYRKKQLWTARYPLHRLMMFAFTQYLSRWLH